MPLENAAISAPKNGATPLSTLLRTQSGLQATVIFAYHWCLDYLDPKRQPSLQRIAKASNVTSTQNEEHYSSEP